MVMQRARSATVSVAITDSFHDRLSGLPNRQLFSDRLQMALHQAARAKTLVAVVVIDLNKTHRGPCRLSSCVRRGAHPAGERAAATLRAQGRHPGLYRA